jgi:hypothetical protein
MLKTSVVHATLCTVTAHVLCLLGHSLAAQVSPQGDPLLQAKTCLHVPSTLTPPPPQAATSSTQTPPAPAGPLQVSPSLNSPAALSPGQSLTSRLHMSAATRTLSAS